MRFTRFARGQKRVVGSVNKTEARYGDLLATRQIAGEVEWYRFEAFKLRLADSTFYTTDFAVMLSTGEFQVHEVKAGRIDKDGKLQMLSEDASRIKIKIASEMYPFRFFWAIERPKKSGGGFEMAQVGKPEEMGRI